jgi:hypothetical protein
LAVLSAIFFFWAGWSIGLAKQWPFGTLGKIDLIGWLLITPTILEIIEWGMTPALMACGDALLWSSGRNDEASIQSESNVAAEPKPNIILRGVMVPRITQDRDETWIHPTGLPDMGSVSGVLAVFANAAKRSERSFGKARTVKASIL